MSEQILNPTTVVANGVPVTTAAPMPVTLVGGVPATSITIESTAITGGTDTRFLYDDAGLIGESAGLTYTKATPAVNVVSAAFGLSGAISAPTWTTNGVRYKNVAAMLTDTTAATGTTATAYTDVWGGNTIAATNTGVIFTNYFGSYFKDPVAGSHVTLTNAWALGADSASIGTSGTFKIATTGNVTSSGSSMSFTGGAVTIGNSASSSGNLMLNGHDGIVFGFSGTFSSVRLDSVTTTSSMLNFGSLGVFGWRSTNTTPNGTADTGLSVVSAGVIGVGTGAAGSTAGTLQLTTLTASGTIATGAPAGSSAGLWKLGALQAGAVVLDTTRSIFVDIGGTVYKLMVAQ